MTPHVPPPPRRGWLFVVRYLSANGTTQTRMYRNGAAARRFAELCIDRGAEPRIYRTDVTRWQEDWPPATSRGVRRRWSQGRTPPTPCAEPGCPHLVRGHDRCPSHQSGTS